MQEFLNQIKYICQITNLNQARFHMETNYLKLNTSVLPIFPMIRFKNSLIK